MRVSVVISPFIDNLPIKGFIRILTKISVIGPGLRYVYINSASIKTYEIVKNTHLAIFCMSDCMLFYPGFKCSESGFRFKPPRSQDRMSTTQALALNPRPGYHFWGITPFSREIGGISPGGPCYLTQYDYQFVKPGYLTYSGHFTLTERDCTRPYITLYYNRKFNPRQFSYDDG